MDLTEIIKKLDKGQALTKEDAIELLSMHENDSCFYALIERADAYSRVCFQNKAVIFAQIGLDAAACSVNCRFCTFACDTFEQDNSYVLSKTDVKEKVKNFLNAGVDEIFLMSTADYEKEHLLQMGESVRQMMPKGMRLVANTGDFDLEYAKRMKEAGFTGVYHICRLGEGEDTDMSVSERIKTLEAIKTAGLELYYCVEPIGPEHSPKQIAEEIFRAIDYEVQVMAVMRRVGFEKSPLYNNGEITARKLALICAVTTLCAKPGRAMGVHEPEIISLIAGANQIYAENGTNPRDSALHTEEGRGMSASRAKRMLQEAGWDVCPYSTQDECKRRV